MAIPAGETAYSLLAKRCFRGIERFYRPVPPRAVELLDHELAMIEQMGFAHYFLVVHDIVRWARARGIACSGRGSAGNSLVCHVLDITASEPIRHNLLFERFLNPNRREMPDIDVDFCSTRRDEVIGHIYDTFGEDNVAVVANVNTMSPRMAVRIVAEAVGFAPTEINALAKNVPRHGDAGKMRDYLAGEWPELADSPLQDESRYGPLLDLVERLDGYPLHLGTHLGGFVIADRPITYYAPLQWAAKGVVVIQFNKDDVADLGLVKMDILGLRTHSAVSETVHLIRQRTGRKIDPYALAPNDPPAYEIISNGGSIGLFQLESAGQRNLATRLQEETFDDIIAAIALYRPGPLEAEMIGPFVDRRWGYEKVSLPHPAMAEALGDTYGVILYQEQVLRVAQLVAGFSPAEADSLRRAMTRDKSREEMAKIGADLRAPRRRPRRPGGRRPGGLPPAGGLRRLRLQQEPLGLLRRHQLRHRLPQGPLPGGVPLRRAEQPAHGLLHPAHGAERRPPLRPRGAPPRHQPLRPGLHRGGRRAPRPLGHRRAGPRLRPLHPRLDRRPRLGPHPRRPGRARGHPRRCRDTGEPARAGSGSATADRLIVVEAPVSGRRPVRASRRRAGDADGSPDGDGRRALPTPLADGTHPGDLVLPRAHRARARAGVAPDACLAPAGALAPGAGQALRVGLRYLKQMSERALKSHRGRAPLRPLRELRGLLPAHPRRVPGGREPDPGGRLRLAWSPTAPSSSGASPCSTTAWTPWPARAPGGAGPAAGLPRPAAAGRPRPAPGSVEDKVRVELELLGLTVTCHPLELYEEELRRLGVTMSYELPALGDEVPVLVAGVYERAQNPWMRSGKRTMFLTLEDAYGLFECVLFESKLARAAPVVARATYFLVRGRLQNNRKRGLAIVVEEIHDLEEVLAKRAARAAAPSARAGADDPGRRPARLGQIVERPTFAEHTLLVAERKQTRVGREPEVYGMGTADGRKRPPGAGTAAIPKKVG